MRHRRHARPNLRRGEHGNDHDAWLTAQKTTVGHTLGTALFFEAGLNLTESAGGQCFSTFLGDTRSSTSLTATLFDFSGGTLGECGCL